MVSPSMILTTVPYSWLVSSGIHTLGSAVGFAVGSRDGVVVGRAVNVLLGSMKTVCVGVMVWSGAAAEQPQITNMKIMRKNLANFKLVTCYPLFLSSAPTGYWDTAGIENRKIVI